MDIGKQQRYITVAASCAMTLVLGTIHAFSIFIPEWENIDGANRARVSLVYSISLASLTIAVFFSHRLFNLLRPPAIFALSGLVAAAGLAASANTDALNELTLFYGVVFGAANGIGYGYALQIAGQAAPATKGLAMGLVTAFYAVGATLAPLVLVPLIQIGGNGLALNSTAVMISIVSVLSALAIWYSKASYKGEPADAIKPLSSYLHRMRILLWLSYGSAVAAGLMVIGHAYGIALWLLPDKDSAVTAPVVLALGNMLGGFSAGYLADKLASQNLLRWLPLASCAGLLFLINPIDSAWTNLMTGLMIVGYCYGALIAVYPVAISDIFGPLAAPRIYGQIFTAWGCAGLVGPWLSGWLFDKTNSYNSAIIIAVLLSVISIFTSRVSAPPCFSD